MSWCRNALSLNIISDLMTKTILKIMKCMARWLGLRCLL